MDNPVGRWTRVALVTNVVLQTAIVVTGGVVRLTGSGLGCPTWPRCSPGSYTPVAVPAGDWHPYIEFGNRLLTFAVGAAAAAVLVLVWRSGRRHLRPLAALPLVGVALQAAIGGVTVLTSLHPVTVSVHFLVSTVIIAVSVVLLVRVHQPDGPAVPVVPSAVRHLTWGLAATAAAVIAVGTVVTGSGPHSGDADAPARYGLDPRTVSWLHADLVLLFVGLLVGLIVALRVTDAPARIRERALWVLVVTVGQALVGYVQYATGLPEVLVAFHMLGACLLTVAVTALVMSLHRRGGTPGQKTKGSTAMATNSSVR